MGPIDALMNPAMNEEEQAAMEAALRGKKQAADFYALSTVQPLQQAGLNSQTDALKAAEAQGGLRRALAERQARADESALQRQHEVDENAKGRVLDQTLAAQRAALAGAPDPRTAPTDKQAETMAGDLQNFGMIQSLADTYEDEFAPNVPLTGEVTNWIAENMPMFTRQSTEDANQWWKNYRRFQELEDRHELFGSALTASEQAAWKAATISPNTNDPDKVRDNLNLQVRLARDMAEHAAYLALSKGIKVNDVKRFYGGAVDVGTMYKQMMDGTYVDIALRKDEQERQERLQGTNRASATGFSNLRVKGT